MRGKGSNCSAAVLRSGITPAYAGKSFAFCHPFLAEWDHPRVCGEKPTPKGIGSARPGSPPRMRGKEYHIRGETNTGGITPAYAGKSFHRPMRSILLRDHPRVCGEKVVFIDEYLAILGSPPRMRGKVGHSFIMRRVPGITPAYAGKRLKRSHSIGHFSYILCLFHSVLHRASVSGGSRAGPCAPPCLPAQNAVPV